MFYTIYSVADFNINMDIRSLKRKKDSSTIEPNKKCAINNKILGFQDLCKEITRQQIDVLKLGNFVIKNLIAFKFI